MNKHSFFTALEECPIIIAIKNQQELQHCLSAPAKVVFVLYGNIMNIGQISHTLKQAGKTVIVHLDLLEGLAVKEISIDFITAFTCADGIITTKQALIKRAKEQGLVAIQRFFILDSLALENTIKQLQTTSADFIEILPGVMPKIIARLCKHTSKPIIAGGLLCDKEDVTGALMAGALAVSSSNYDVWFL